MLKRSKIRHRRRCKIQNGRVLALGRRRSAHLRLTPTPAEMPAGLLFDGERSAAPPGATSLHGIGALHLGKRRVYACFVGPILGRDAARTPHRVDAPGEQPRAQSKITIGRG